MPALTLWAVNTVASWDPEPLVEALARPTVFGAKNDVVLGNRAPFDRASDGSTQHALSHEDGDPLAAEDFLFSLPSHSTGTGHRKCLEMNPRHGRLRD